MIKIISYSLKTLCVKMHRYLPKSNDITQITMIAVFARAVVDLNLNGKHMAYHRSIDMKVSVKMLILTDTV